jgi:hypothetical protein
VSPLYPGDDRSPDAGGGCVARVVGEVLWLPVERPLDAPSERALYVIDAEGVVHWSYVSPVGFNPGAEGILRALEELQGRTGR